MKQLHDWLHKLPVIGFNSGKYDLNAVKQFLVPYFLSKKEEEEEMEQDDKEKEEEENDGGNTRKLATSGVMVNIRKSS